MVDLKKHEKLYEDVLHVGPQTSQYSPGVGELESWRRSKKLQLNGFWVALSHTKQDTKLKLLPLCKGNQFVKLKLLPLFKTNVFELYVHRQVKTVLQIVKRQNEYVFTFV